MTRKILVIGQGDVGRRACANLQASGAIVVHLDEPTDGQLHEVLGAGIDGVAVMLHDDIKALRYSLVANSAGTATAGLAAQPDGPALFEGASEGFAEASRVVSWVAAGFVFLGLLASFLLPRNAARIETEGYAPPRDHAPMD